VRNLILCVTDNMKLLVLKYHSMNKVFEQVGEIRSLILERPSLLVHLG